MLDSVAIVNRISNSFHLFDMSVAIVVARRDSVPSIEVAAITACSGAVSFVRLDFPSRTKLRAMRAKV